MKEESNSTEWLIDLMFYLSEDPDYAKGVLERGNDDCTQMFAELWKQARIELTNERRCQFGLKRKIEDLEKQLGQMPAELAAAHDKIAELQSAANLAKVEFGERELVTVNNIIMRSRHGNEFVKAAIEAARISPQKSECGRWDVYDRLAVDAAIAVYESQLAERKLDEIKKSNIAKGQEIRHLKKEVESLKAAIKDNGPQLKVAS